MKIVKKELIKTAKELNELMGLDPAIPTGKDVEESVLIEKIAEAAEMLEEDDEISEVAQEVIDYIAEMQEEGAEEQPADKEEAEETTEQLVEKSDYKALKAMVAWYPEFEGIDIALYPAKKGEDLKARMLKDLAKKVEDLRARMLKDLAKEEEKPAAKKETVKKDTPAKKEGEKKETKKSVVEEFLMKKGGSTIEEMAQAICDRKIDSDLKKNKTVVKLWLGKMGYKVSKSAIAENPLFSKK